jgi:adenylate cyclase
MASQKNEWSERLRTKESSMIKSLKQKLSLLLILPVALLLFLSGVSGFIYVRKALLDEWRESAILKLERAAHYMDMRLSRPMEWIKMFHETAESRGGPAAQELILTRLRDLEGVTNVNLKWTDNHSEPSHMVMQNQHMGVGSMMQFHRAVISEVTAPRYDAQTKQKTVTLISDFKDESGRLVGRLEVSLGFDFLMQDINKYGWWESSMTCLVDTSGRYLAHSSAMKGRTRLGETEDPVELAVMKSIREKPYGTHLGPGYPPKLVSGFYRIQQAPWIIVMFAPGKDILAPIVEFRFYYAIAGSLCIVFILVLIQFVGGRMVGQIGKISDAAKKVSRGDYVSLLPITSSDEIGQLKVSFNTMIQGLKERDFIRDTFGRYMDPEIARELMKRPEASRMGGEKREVAVLMSDIRGFTSVSESLSPEKTIRILNHYFSHMIEVIQHHKGVIVDFYGDGILVFFDPLEGHVKKEVQRAIHCGLEIQQSMTLFNKEMKSEDLPELQTGIGINVGDVIVGNIGSATRAKYGIVGSAVNITQRIQAEAKGGEVIISDSAYGFLEKELKIKQSFSAQLKGVNGKMNLHIVESVQNKLE